MPRTLQQIYYDAFHDGDHPWQEPWAVIDATTDNLLVIWYPDRDEQRAIHVPPETYGQFAYSNFNARIRDASTMPKWARHHS